MIFEKYNITTMNITFCRIGLRFHAKTCMNDDSVFISKMLVQRECREWPRDNFQQRICNTQWDKNSYFQHIAKGVLQGPFLGPLPLLMFKFCKILYLLTLDKGAHLAHASPTGGLISGWGAGTTGLSFSLYSVDVLICEKLWMKTSNFRIKPAYNFVTSTKPKKWSMEHTT